MEASTGARFPDHFIIDARDADVTKVIETITSGL
jgi:hypothetical protein